MPTKQQFIARVRELTDQTPYTVEETADGCAVRIDVVDARWHTLLAKEGLEKTFSHSVKLDEQAGTLMITDGMQEIEWSAGASSAEGGAPRLKGSATWTSGRVFDLSGKKVHAWGEDGGYGPQVDYAFSSSEGRALINKVGQEQGWTGKRGLNERIGLYAAVGSIALALVIGLLLLITLL